MSSATEQESRPSEDSFVSPTRLVVTGIGLTLLIAFVMPDWVIRTKGKITAGQFMPVIPVISVLCLLVLRPVLPGRRWSNGELLGLFCVLLVGISGMGLVGKLIAILPSSYYFASPENDYFNHFLSEIPAFIGPSNALRGESSWDAMVWFYRGLPAGQSTPWNVWFEPLAWWGVLIGFVLVGQFCLGCLFRKQWLEHEKLMFPHTSVVASLLEPSEDMDRPLYKMRMFWIGLGASVVFFGIDGLNVYFPEIPKIGFAKITLTEILNDYPWKALSNHRQLSIQPFIVAIAYMVTTEVSFSIWLMAIIDLVCRVLAWSMTMTTAVRDAWIGEAAINSGATHFGALVVFVGVFLWSGRSHFHTVYLKAIGRERIDDSDELLGFTLAFWGFWFCVVGVIFWCWLVGIPLWFSGLVFGIYCVMVLYVSRLMAETGMVTTKLWWIKPHLWATSLVGYKAGGTVTGADGSNKPVLLRPLGVFSLIYTPMMVGNHFLAHAMTGFRVTDTIGGKRRQVGWISLAALVTGTVVFAWRFLETTYQVGALNVDANWYREVYHIYNNTLIRDILLRERSHTPDWTIISFMGWGMVVMGFLVYMRQSFYWWPIHPIGYITPLTHGLWFSVFLGWLIKTRVLKYGGGEGYKRLIPLFVGLFVGEYVAAAIWSVVGALTGLMRFDVLALQELSF